MSADGALAFARYAYPPNELGYCGPPGAGAMLNPAAVPEIERRARQFEGAWVYLEVLAEVFGTADPLASEVVEAYWIGSDRLDEVEPARLSARLLDRFAGQSGGTWRDATQRARAHHSFQVFEVYPWATMLRRGLSPAPAVTVLDRCRIRVGVVRAVVGEAVTVLTRPLGWDGSRLAPGDALTETVRWSRQGRSLIDAPAAGDLVALHWDWVCEVLTPEQARRVDVLESAQRAALELAL